MPPNQAERAPEEDPRLQFEAVARLDAEEKRLIKHEPKRWIKQQEAS